MTHQQERSAGTETVFENSSGTTIQGQFYKRDLFDSANTYLSILLPLRFEVVVLPPLHQNLPLR